MASTEFKGQVTDDGDDADNDDGDDDECDDGGDDNSIYNSDDDDDDDGDDAFCEWIKPLMMTMMMMK